MDQSGHSKTSIKTSEEQCLLQESLGMKDAFMSVRVYFDLQVYYWLTVGWRLSCIALLYIGMVSVRSNQFSAMDRSMTGCNDSFGRFGLRIFSWRKARFERALPDSVSKTLFVLFCFRACRDAESNRGRAPAFRNLVILRKLFEKANVAMNANQQYLVGMQG